MMATRRNQAVHDLLTRSTVQIRDTAKALPQHFITERAELSSATMPSRGRRVGIIAVYLVLTFVAYMIASLVMVGLGIMSDACLDHDACTPVEKMLTIAFGLALLFIAAAWIGLGWRGRLYGARRTA
jgi:hypothetical protein